MTICHAKQEDEKELVFKFGFIEEFCICTFLSVAKEKYQKNRHLRESPTVPPLRNPTT